MSSEGNDQSSLLDPLELLLSMGLKLSSMGHVGVATSHEGAGERADRRTKLDDERSIIGVS